AAYAEGWVPARAPLTRCWAGSPPELFPQQLRNRLAAFDCIRRPAEIARARFRIGQHLLDRLDDRGGGFRLAEMIEHHRGRPDLPDRVGDALTGDVRRRAVHRLEHGRVFALRIDVAAGRNADRAGAGRAEVGEDIAEQVRAHHDVEAVRLEHEQRGENIYVVLVPLHV